MIQEFDCSNSGFLEHDGETACRLNVATENKGAGPMREHGDCAIGDFRNESQCSLGANQNVRKDIQRILKVEEASERVPHGIFDLRFLKNPLDELWVRSNSLFYF